MKKIIVIAAIALAAVSAQAAAVDWSASAVFDPWTTASTGSNTPANGWLGYMILASDLSTVTADLANGDTSSLVSSAVGPMKTSSNKGAFTTSTASGSVAAGSQNFYMIVLNAGDIKDATFYYLSSMVTKEVDASLDTTVNFGTQAANSKPVANWTSMGGGAIPEPTSGLLLLLGVASLALRRKRV